ncbi:ATP-dependent Clp protease ATP-binding subunit [soil metagenome]
MPAIFGRFSRQSEAVLIEAQKIAERLSRPVQSDIVLLSILSQAATPAGELLKHLGATYSGVFDQIPPLAGTLEDELPGQSHEMQLLLEESIKLAGKYRFALVELEHILYVMCKDDKYLGRMVLEKAGVDPDAVTIRLSEWLLSVAALNQGMGRSQQSQSSPEQTQESELEKYSTNLTELAYDGELDAVIGREAELDQLIHILLRRKKNNPLLLGEPGVGKTAIVDALAARIVAGNVPTALKNKRILTVDLSAIVAGTMYRGQFEERLKNLIQETTALGECILFIDEIHTLTGTGSSEGGFDAANILKPALARGELSLIGATTHEEYRKHIRKDKALDRRFQTIQVNEPSAKEAIAMLRGTKKQLEDHHAVTITDEAIKSAVELATRYVHDRFLPDKAVDILDEAATLHAEIEVGSEDARAIERELGFIESQKITIISQAISPDDWQLAKELGEKEDQLKGQLEKLSKHSKRRKTLVSIGASDVAKVVSRRTGVPLEQVEQTLKPLDISRVQKVMEKHVFGQGEAIKKVAQALLRSQLGFQSGKKPMGSFLFVGPTGTGKTETARILAREVFGDTSALIKVDMSEYMERHSVSNLVGAPAGYVGFDQGGSLTEQVSRKPYSVVLFDEVEKAHPDVFNLLLQILEDGILTDNTGRVTSFEHTLIIMTSNIGMRSFNAAAKIGFATHSEDAETKQAELEAHIGAQIKDFFKPELLGRLSGTVFFKPLGTAVVEKLVKRRAAELKAILKKRGVELVVEPSFLSWAVEKYMPEAGARSIEKIYMHDVEPELITAVLEHPGVALHLTAAHGILKILAPTPTH